MEVAFFFEYQDVQGRRQFSWHMEETTLSQRVFGGWHDTEVAALEEANTFLDAVRAGEIPSAPIFHATGRLDA